MEVGGMKVSAIELTALLYAMECILCVNFLVTLCSCH